MSSNLPPGVTDSMIPGNRPEDLAEEAFWEALYEKAGVTSEDSLDAEGVVRLIQAARDLAYQAGYNAGHAEAEMSYCLVDSEVDERAALTDTRIITLPSGTEISVESALGDLTRVQLALREYSPGSDFTAEVDADVEHVRELLTLLAGQVGGGT